MSMLLGLRIFWVWQVTWYYAFLEGISMALCCSPRISKNKIFVLCYYFHWIEHASVVAYSKVTSFSSFASLKHANYVDSEIAVDSLIPRKPVFSSDFEFHNLHSFSPAMWISFHDLFQGMEFLRYSSVTLLHVSYACSLDLGNGEGGNC